MGSKLTKEHPMEKTTCPQCKEVFESPTFEDLWHRDYLCPGCWKVVQQQKRGREEAERRADRESRWNSICPARLRDTVQTKLPDPAAAATVLAWVYGPEGILAHGPTGSGKTRSIYLLIQREFMAGRSVEACSAASFSTHCSRLFFDSLTEAEKFMGKLASVGLLLLDDLDKARFTERVASALFELVDRRTSNNLPLFVTLNAGPGTLEGRLPTDLGPALIRRLMEFCTPIEFRK